jgi:hypothetical protein
VGYRDASNKVTVIGRMVIVEFFFLVFVPFLWYKDALFRSRQGRRRRSTYLGRRTVSSSVVQEIRFVLDAKSSTATFMEAK